MVDHHLSWRRAGADRAQREPVRRLAARCAESSFALIQEVSMNALSKTLSAAAVLMTITGCATDYHYSQLDGRRWHAAAIDTYPVIVSKVDGKSAPQFQPVLV